MIAGCTRCRPTWSKAYSSASRTARLACPRLPGAPVDPVAERRVLPRPPDDVGQRDAADDAVALVRGQHGERERRPGRPRALVELELEALAGDRVEALVPRRVPRARVLAVRAAQRSCSSTSSSAVGRIAVGGSSRRRRRGSCEPGDRRAGDGEVGDGEDRQMGQGRPSPPALLSAASSASSAGRKGNSADTTCIAS